MYLGHLESLGCTTVARSVLQWLGLDVRDVRPPDPPAPPQLPGTIDPLKTRTCAVYGALPSTATLQDRRPQPPGRPEAARPISRPDRPGQWHNQRTITGFRPGGAMRRSTVACGLARTVRGVQPLLGCAGGFALGAGLLSGCATGAYQQGERSARAGDWEPAVASYQRALREAPGRADVRIALERAKLNASRHHIEVARAFEARNDLAGALAEYQTARGYDPSNGQTRDRIAAIDYKIRDRSDTPASAATPDRTGRPRHTASVAGPSFVGAAQSPVHRRQSPGHPGLHRRRGGDRRRLRPGIPGPLLLGPA